ncbi:hypothetical protein D3C84_473240 [compost metagenome]
MRGIDQQRPLGRANERDRGNRPGRIQAQVKIALQPLAYGRLLNRRPGGEPACARLPILEREPGQVVFPAQYCEGATLKPGFIV